MSPPSDRDSRSRWTKAGKARLIRDGHSYSAKVILDDSDDSNDGVTDSSSDDSDHSDDSSDDSSTTTDDDDDSDSNDESSSDDEDAVLRDQPRGKPTKMCGALADMPGKDRDESDFWEPGKKIRVRFLDGTSATHKLVKQHAKTWEKYANISFRFVMKGSADIRISFRGQGSYSQVGIHCLKVKDQNSPTMNLEIKKNNAKRVVLHEFGHALGLLHEHSSPKAGIPWNEEAVYKHYESLGWDRNKVKANVLKVQGVSVGGFDKDSIMMYPVDAKLTIGGYSVPWTKKLSKLDKEAIRLIYPFDGDGEQKSKRRQKKKGKSVKRSSK